MKRNSAICALAVFVLMGTIGVAASADYPGVSEYGYGPGDSSVSAQPEEGMDQQATGEIREPIETGALPDHSVNVDSSGWLNMGVSEQNSRPELWGLPNIQSGGGGE
jgi:hypothetical protein